MKTCPYCAEEIQDAAIKCRYCQSWLVSEIPAEAETPPAGVVVHEPREPAPSAATGPAEGRAEEEVSVQERTTEIPAATEPVAATEPEGEERPAEAAGTATTATAGAEPQAAAAPPEFTHSGQRFLLGYTDDFFGIWDRQSPESPTERFPRTDEGWREAWQRYVAIESNWMDLRSGQRSP